mmetsp:Transcript_12478/g.38060  ORF Transcript_12478/g.38060 Transcript_12478/m.38060 type:complete len:388 (+) Transcript_12478:120-1283(+)|eukprot:CAMPEP_0198729016 /NCGR_PEP_ID=MMETSP1475-20131203/13524_1 /TAXON_ID= ORGANISM="Unidentified sp., Strain CCMP1999" /NCGR_SAMPLE_ID=MMETSP1475 /ASSEMBLY_ACC=CAM_ASM_001111 /LENGTH=387 /DNA_ID=CAMNT_0044491541 /DNA_START=78 /DNA_END=1241 /DNA_ORIENTATION=+
MPVPHPRHGLNHVGFVVPILAGLSLSEQSGPVCSTRWSGSAVVLSFSGRNKCVLRQTDKNDVRPAEKAGKGYSAADSSGEGEKVNDSQNVDEEAPSKTSSDNKLRKREPMSEEARERISKKLTGRKLSEETKDKIRAAARELWEKRKSDDMKGPRRSREMNMATRKKISEALKGRKMSPEVKQKISAALKGRKFSDEHRSALSERFMGENNPMYGRQLTEDTKRRISQKMQQLRHSKSPTTKDGKPKRKRGRPRKHPPADDSDSDALSKRSSSVSDAADLPNAVPLDNVYEEEEYDQLMEAALSKVEPPKAVSKALGQSKAQKEAQKTALEKENEGVCKVCDGNGVRSCSYCVQRLGVVSTSCPRCHGVGLEFCAACEGSGVVDSGK